MLAQFSEQVEIIKIEKLDSGYAYNQARYDETLGALAESAIEFVLKKRVVQPTPKIDVEQEFQQAHALHEKNKIEEEIYNLNKTEDLKHNANIKIYEEMSGGSLQPSYIRFENATGDYRNDVRFMNKQMLDIKMKGVTIKEPSWDIEFNPTQQMIDRFKFQVSAHTEETFFQFSTSGKDLSVNFGELNSNSGSFVCYNGITRDLRNEWNWPKAEVVRVLRLTGNKTIKISDLGMLQIIVDSGIAEYKYTFKGIRG